MHKKAIIDLLTEKHASFINYINSLTREEYLYSFQGKWTAGQQLSHIVLCVKPLVQVLSMDQPAIALNFGLADRTSCTYDVLQTDYLRKLTEGGKAPERYVPGAVSTGQREPLNDALKKLIGELCSRIDGFTEQELDRLCLPHPLLGKLTLREMLYNAIFHVGHHHEQVERHIKDGAAH